MKSFKFTPEIVATGLIPSYAIAATIINPIEFKEDDQAGVDL